MAVTGALLAYEQRIVNAVDARHRSDVAGAESPRSLETVAASALEIVGGEAALDIEVKADPAEPVTARVGRERVLFLDARSGRMLGEGSQTIRQVFAAITGIHRWLGASGEHRQTARAATGAANLAFLVLVLSGLYLWLPRRWTFRQVRNVAWFRRGLSGKARDCRRPSDVCTTSCSPRQPIASPSAASRQSPAPLRLM